MKIRGVVLETRSIAVYESLSIGFSIAFYDLY